MIYDDKFSYDFRKGELITDLNLEIGSNKIPRFSCSAQKVNLAIRKAIQLSAYFKSYKKGVFSSNYQCSQTQEEIEKYLQLLLPLYIYTND